MGIFKYYPSNPKKLDPEMEKRIFIHSLIFPAAFVVVFWIVEIIEQTLGTTFVRLGVYPLHVKGLPGILFSPFIHFDFDHLISNSIPFFILMFMLIYFYRRISYRIFIQLYLLAGLCVWLSGREAWHIGASGVVYAMAAFHFVSGIIRNDVRLLTLSVVVVFLYGGMVWGMFPINPDVSWEGHLWGAVSGVALAVYYRKYIIRRDKFDWEDEDEEDTEIDDEESQFTVGEENTHSQSSVEKKDDDKKWGDISHTGEF
ncbi:rhomboid family intramembrane serine protease [Maribellus comscasis]|uniref:Rhomboid family intramembrane serine protease n=1 Tax=Maribellus comscasis TaxID=2681766 RepID=A0A6I6JZ19_9BACT|nr:rhomboid family intramembrane serine protease [Maribellus comscasis]QGY45442.1 rhomboid family intramembrane serine protease [Maribellus comscasis]